MPGQKLIISSIKTGLDTYEPAFLLNNDAFPTLENAYVWRDRILKKRGTELLGRLQRQLVTQSLGNTDGGGAISVNIISLLSLQANSNIVPGSISVFVGAQTFTEPVTPDGTLSNGAGGTGTINYATGALTIQTNPVLAVSAVTITFNYFPDLPVMGIEDFSNNALATSGINNAMTVFFDTVYAYLFDYGTRKFFDASFFKMPAPQNRVTWSGQNYQQFWSWNIQNALFVTNDNPGFHFKVITNISQAATAQVTIANHGLVVNDQVFFNEVSGMVEINGLTGTVLVIVGPNDFTVNINSTAFTPYSSGGIAQYLTSDVGGSGDGIRWFDGFGANLGFVNFAPPLQQFNPATLLHPSYLVGAQIIIAYQGRIYALGTFEQTSNGTVQYFRNRIRACQVGTVYYSSLTPAGQPSQPDSWVDNIPGKGFFVDIDTTEKILTAAINQEIMILGLEKTQRKLIGTSNPLEPIILQIINPEFGSESTFSAIALDKGILSVGDFGYILTTSFNAQRFDLKIPDTIYQIQNNNNGNKRVSAIRDWRNEFIYFTYPLWNSLDIFPNRSVLFNYRENNFAIFREEYTTYGYFQEQSSKTWAQYNYLTWEQWLDPWESGIEAALYSDVTGGNQQGFVLKKVNNKMANDQSHYIQNIVGITITSPNHLREMGDFILIQNALGVTNLNGQVVKVTKIVDNNNFEIDLAGIGTYLGNGTFSIIDNFSILTKQFPFVWPQGLATRIGTQKYLFDGTASGEVTIDLFTSQNTNTPANDPIVSPYQTFTNIVRTRPDDSLGLHDAAADQEQIWHRESQSFTGDSVQIGIRFSENQMRALTIANSDVVLYSIVIDYYPSRILA